MDLFLGCFILICLVMIVKAGDRFCCNIGLEKNGPYRLIKWSVPIVKSADIDKKNGTGC